jgi:hypothetical protein
MKPLNFFRSTLTVLALFFVSIPALAEYATQTYPGWDSAGGDFDSFQSGNGANCAQTCREKANCTASEFVSSTGRCWLKNRITTFTRLQGATLYLKIVAGRAGIDYPGGDYHSYASPHWQDCSRACFNSTRCKAFTFVNQTGTCWLKDRIVDAAFLDGAVSGRR